MVEAALRELDRGDRDHFTRPLAERAGPGGTGTGLKDAQRCESYLKSPDS